MLTLEGQTCCEMKNAKESNNVWNNDGSDKQGPLTIGKSFKPHCFKDIKTLPVKHCANTKAWMTTTIFTEFLRALSASMCVQGRKSLLFMDGCAIHSQGVSCLRKVNVV